MEELNFTLPDLDWDLGKPFWEACNNEMLMFPHCDTCDHWQWYPTVFCPTCQQSLRWKSVSPQATLYSWTVVRRAYFPEFANQIPLIVAVVDIDDAPGVRLLANPIDCKQEDLSIGMKMDVVFAQAAENIRIPKLKIRK